MVSAVSQNGHAAIALAQLVVHTFAQSMRILSSVRRSQGAGIVEIALQLGIFIDVGRASLYVCPRQLLTRLAFSTREDEF